MARPIPGQDDLVKLIQASLLNSRDLLDDARLLLGAGRAPRAHALATLAFEEIGRANLCILTLVPPVGIPDAGTFWNSLRNHEAKLLWAGGLLNVIIRESPGPLSEVAERLGSESKAAHLRKLRGLYVDYSGSGELLTPSDVTAGEATELIEDVQAVLDFLAPAWGDAGISNRLGEFTANADELAADFGQVRRALENNPDETLDGIREWIKSQHPMFGHSAG